MVYTQDIMKFCKLTSKHAQMYFMQIVQDPNYLGAEKE